MKRGTWSFFDPSTGEIADRRFTGSERALRLNTPQGLTPILGAFDRLTHFVDVVALRASADPVTAIRTRAGDSGDLNKRAAEAKAKRIVANAETRQARAVREALLALLPDGPEKKRLQQIEDEIKAQRSRLPQPVG